MGGFLELIDSWGYALSETLKAQLQTGSAGSLLVVYGAGVLTSFTPCVYPMIPVTVTFIGSASGGDRRRAVSLSMFYVAGMALIYAALGMAAALLGQTFGKWTQSPWIYAAVAVLIAVFALAMMGKIDIPVPGFAARTQTSGVQRGGYGGAIMMGAAAGFIAAPCTAPVLFILLLYVGQTRDMLWGGLLLLVFAIGLSTLLMLLGIFSGLLASIPKAGVWMNRIKTIFSIGMLGAAAFFLYRAIKLWTA